MQILLIRLDLHVDCYQLSISKPTYINISKPSIIKIVNIYVYTVSNASYDYAVELIKLPGSQICYYIGHLKGIQVE